MSEIAPKIDRRILRTRKLLWEALISLIEEKDYSEITIQDIADRADVNRVTFYLHYRDKQELLVKSVEMLFEELTAKTTPLIGENFRLDVPPPGMTLVYQYIAENAGLFCKLLSANGIPLLMNRMRKFLAGLTIQRFRLIMPPGREGPVPLEIVAEYAAGSILGLIIWWLEAGMPIPPEEFAHQTLLLTAHGPYWAAGIQPPEEEDAPR